MNSLEPETLPTDLLFHIERRIARRADELARHPINRFNPSVDYWWQAEREVWESGDLVGPPITRVGFTSV
jgi:hypothetical protein